MFSLISAQTLRRHLKHKEILGCQVYNDDGNTLPNTQEFLKACTRLAAAVPFQNMSQVHYHPLNENFGKWPQANKRKNIHTHTLGGTRLSLSVWPPKLNFGLGRMQTTYRAIYQVLVFDAILHCVHGNELLFSWTEFNRVNGHGVHPVELGQVRNSLIPFLFPLMGTRLDLERFWVSSHLTTC